MSEVELPTPDVSSDISVDRPGDVESGLAYSDTDSVRTVNNMRSYMPREPRRRVNREHRNGYVSETEDLLEHAGTDDTVTNNWDRTNIKQIKVFHDRIWKDTFIYQYVLDDKKTRSTRLNTSALIFTTLATVSIASQYAITDYTTTLIMNIISGVLSAMATAIMTAINLYKFTDSINELSKYVQKLDGFMGKLISVLLTRSRHRDDANIIVPKLVDEFRELITSQPNMSIQYIKEAESEFVKCNADQKYLVVGNQKPVSSRNTVALKSPMFSRK